MQVDEKEFHSVLYAFVRTFEIVFKMAVGTHRHTCIGWLCFASVGAVKLCNNIRRHKANANIPLLQPRGGSGGRRGTGLRTYRRHALGRLHAMHGLLLLLLLLLFFHENACSSPHLNE